VRTTVEGCERAVVTVRAEATLASAVGMRAGSANVANTAMMMASFFIARSFSCKMPSPVFPPGEFARQHETGSDFEETLRE
jgi:hypothetical protein